MRRVRHEELSCAHWRGAKGADHSVDSAHLRAGVGHLGQLEGDGEGVTDDAVADLYQFQSQADSNRLIDTAAKA